MCITSDLQVEQENKSRRQFNYSQGHRLIQPHREENHTFFCIFTTLRWFRFSILFKFSCFFCITDKTISKSRGHTVALECPIDVQSCGNLHSVKWFRGNDRVAVVSGNGSLTHVEGAHSGR